MGGVYTGNETTGVEAAVAPPPVTAGVQPTQSGGAAQGNSQAIEQLLNQLAAQLGMPIEQVKQLFPADTLMGKAYSAETIANSPVIQSLRNGTQLSAYNTGARPSGVTNLTGVRGGQDINATDFLSATQGQQGLIQGAVMADGQYWPDTQQQMMRSAPLTNLAAGAQGRRRF